VNFLQLERFSGFCEQSFDFFAFNKVLIQKQINGKKALVFDPSFISKAGKKNTRSWLFLEWLCRKSKMGFGVLPHFFMIFYWFRRISFLDLWISDFGFDKENCLSFI
jgi:hypothetical protein